MMKTALVTGGTGFLGSHIIVKLLQRGYMVRTTIRSKNKIPQLIQTMKNNDISNIENLSFFVADLATDNGWKEAMENVDYVFSVASPVFFDIPKNESEAIKPAVNGIIRVLKFANQENVKRVVMTSNFGAVGFSKKKSSIPTTEKDWTNIDQEGISIYEKSKLIAEKRAWDFVKDPDVSVELTTINPVAMLGPSLNHHVSGSFDLILDPLSGKQKMLVDIPLNIVDIRDVAEIHILAMENPSANGQRFIASADGQISLAEIMEIIKTRYPEKSKKIPKITMPNWLIKVLAPLNKQAKIGKLFIEMNRTVSNKKAKEVLNWQPISDNKQLIIDTMDSLIKNNLI